MSETISQTVSDYVQAMTYADASLLRDVFDPRASIVGNYEGATEWLSLEDFIHQIRSADQGLQDQQPDFTIFGIDKVGDTASVKLTTRFWVWVFPNTCPCWSVTKTGPSSTSSTTFRDRKRPAQKNKLF